MEFHITSVRVSRLSAFLLSLARAKHSWVKTEGDKDCIFAIQRMVCDSSSDIGLAISGSKPNQQGEGLAPSSPRYLDCNETKKIEMADSLHVLSDTGKNQMELI